MTAADRELSVAYRKAIANDPCAYCRGNGEHDDHVHPLSQGGTDHWWNLVRACSRCNLEKANRTVEQWLAARGYPVETANAWLSRPRWMPIPTTKARWIPAPAVEPLATVTELRPRREQREAA